MSSLTQVRSESGEHAGEAEPWFSVQARSALIDVLKKLEVRGYDFVTSTPSSHARVLKRPDRQTGASLRDVLGWSLPFRPDAVDAEMLDILQRAGAVVYEGDDVFRPLLRVSRLEGALFLHSAYPTATYDSVFLGPDSYRFAQLIATQMQHRPARILDYGAGAGVGGIVAARIARTQLTIADINPKALFLASINAEHAGVDHDTTEVSAPQQVAGQFDLIVTHPPFMIDRDHRAYRDGGDLYGARLSLDWILQGSALLAPGGRLILHTGVSIVGGRDVLLDALREQLPALGARPEYRELDPDIFGEELDQPCYAQVERIAAVGLVLNRAVA